MTTLNKIKQNIHFLQDNHLIQQEQITEQYDLLYLTRKETTENRKLLIKLGRDLLQLDASFTVTSREIIMLVYDKNFIFNYVNTLRKIAVL